MALKNDMAEKTQNTSIEMSRQQQVRITIISGLYKRGYGIYEIRDEIQKRLDLKSYTSTDCRNDIATMLAEWKETRLDNCDQAVTLELVRIDEMIREAWAAWDRSKENFKRNVQRQKAIPNVEGGGDDSNVDVVSMEQEHVEESQIGDPRFLQLINTLSSERRKLLGLYAPERHEITGANGGAIETKFTGFAFLPHTDGLDNSENSRIAAGEEIPELPLEEQTQYAEIVEVEPEKVPVYATTTD